MKNSNDNIGNRTRDLPGCSAMPQQLRHCVLHHVHSGYFILRELDCIVYISFGVNLVLCFLAFVLCGCVYVWVL
jgi:hypothetical protein